MSRHAVESELALLASGDCGWLDGLRLKRHARGCAECRALVDAFAADREAVRDLEIPDWEGLAREMRANIRVGLEAGECVRGGTVVPSYRWSFRPMLAMASLVALVSAGFVLKRSGTNPVQMASPVVVSSEAGVEFRSGDTSMMLLNHKGSVSEQTVSAQGEIRSRYVDSETGAVTINNVYLQ
jgi:hypothetical protein